MADKKDEKLTKFLWIQMDELGRNDFVNFNFDGFC